MADPVYGPPRPSEKPRSLDELVEFTRREFENTKDAWKIGVETERGARLRVSQLRSRFPQVQSPAWAYLIDKWFWRKRDESKRKASRRGLRFTIRDWEGFHGFVDGPVVSVSDRRQIDELVKSWQRPPFNFPASSAKWLLDEFFVHDRVYRLSEGLELKYGTDFSSFAMDCFAKPPAAFYSTLDDNSRRFLQIFNSVTDRAVAQAKRNMPSMRAMPPNMKKDDCSWHCCFERICRANPAFRVRWLKAHNNIGRTATVESQRLRMMVAAEMEDCKRRRGMR